MFVYTNCITYFYIPMARNNQLPPSPIELPEGTRKEQTIARGIRWPKSLYEDLYKLCSEANVSITSVVVSLTRSWVEREKPKTKRK